MLSLVQIRPFVFKLSFDSHRELSMTFVRYTEFYESKYDHIRGQKFTLVEQMGSYVREYKGDRDDDWTYSSDFSGFNIPVEVIKNVHDLGIKDQNHYDQFMIGIYHLIMAETNYHKAYLIGVTTDNDDVKKGTLKHELTHALWYLDDEYREKCTMLIENQPNLREELVGALAEQNYPEKVANDEISAYLTSGTAGFFDEVNDQDGLLELTKDIRTLHKKHYGAFIEVENESSYDEEKDDEE